MIKLVIVLSLLFTPAVASASPNDKTLHFGVSAGLSTLFYNAYKEQGHTKASAKVAAFASTLAIGIAKELSDQEFSSEDLLFDAMGAAFPLFTIYW